MCGRWVVLCVLAPSLTVGSVTEVHPGESIQEAVNMALADDTVLIHDGAYSETVVLYGKRLTIGSLFLVDGDTTHVAATTLEAGATRPDTNSCFVYCHSERAGRLVGLTLTNGSGTYSTRAGGFRAGGAVYVDAADVSIEKCCVHNSESTYGGGLAVFGRRRPGVPARVHVSECSFYYCYSDGWGGGVFADQCSLYVKRCSFFGNYSNIGSGGIDVLDCHAEVDSCVIRECDGAPGGLAFHGGSGRAFACVFDGNVGVLDSHLRIWGSTCTVSGCVFRNSACDYPQILLGSETSFPVHFVGNIIEDNSSNTYTGTVCVCDPGGGEIAYNVIRRNVNVNGGAIYAFQNSTVRVHHNVFEENVSLHPNRGSVLLANAEGRPTLNSNVIVGNSGVAVSYEWDYPVAIHAENNWWGDPSGPHHPTLNPEGRGDTILQDSIYFIPWLTEPPDTTMPSAVAPRLRSEVSATWRLAAVYPNPFNSEIQIVVAGFAGSDFRIDLYNIMGERVDEIHDGPMTGGTLRYQAPSALATGVYFVRAASQGHAETRKVMLLR